MATEDRKKQIIDGMVYGKGDDKQTWERWDSSSITVCFSEPKYPSLFDVILPVLSGHPVKLL